MATELFNRMLRHQVRLERAKSGESKKLAVLLKENDEKIFFIINSIPEHYSVRDINVAIKKIKRINSRFYKKEFLEFMESSLKNTVAIESQFAASVIDENLNPKGKKVIVPAAEDIIFSANNKKFDGKKMSAWFSATEKDKNSRISKQLRILSIDEEPVTKLLSEVKKQTRISNGNAKTISKANIGNASNVTREMIYESNDDKVKEIVWSTILDSGTTITCGARSLKHYDAKTKDPIDHDNLWGGGPGVIHWGCRSLGIPTDKDGIITSGPSEGSRYDEGTKTAIGAGEEYERGDNKKEDGTRYKIPRKENELEKQLLDGSINYESWLRTQPRDFVEDTLGVGKASLFIDSKKALSSFVVEDGRELTLAQLI